LVKVLEGGGGRVDAEKVDEGGVAALTGVGIDGDRVEALLRVEGPTTAARKVKFEGRYRWKDVDGRKATVPGGGRASIDATGSGEETFCRHANPATVRSAVLAKLRVADGERLHRVGREQHRVVPGVLYVGVYANPRVPAPLRSDGVRSCEFELAGGVGAGKLTDLDEGVDAVDVVGDAGDGVGVSGDRSRSVGRGAEERTDALKVFMVDRRAESRLSRRCEQLRDDKYGEGDTSGPSKAPVHLALREADEGVVFVDGDALLADHAEAEEGLHTATDGGTNYDGHDGADDRDEDAVESSM
jgi:hypothetical protein